MAACKPVADAAHGVDGSTVVTTMARNGTDFGIRVSGLGDRWFTAPAQIPKGLYFPIFEGALVAFAERYQVCGGSLEGRRCAGGI